jgi:hypothetical protein
MSTRKQLDSIHRDACSLDDSQVRFCAVGSPADRNKWSVFIVLKDVLPAARPDNAAAKNATFGRVS